MKYGILEGLSLLEHIFISFLQTYPPPVFKNVNFDRCQKIANIQMFGMTPVLPLETSNLHRNLA